jgi:hypothetical protein
VGFNRGRGCLNGRQQGDGSSSYIGTFYQEIPGSGPTVNYHGLTPESSDETSQSNGAFRALRSTTRSTLEQHRGTVAHYNLFNDFID